MVRDMHNSTSVFTHEIFARGPPAVPRPYFEAFECPERITGIVKLVNSVLSDPSRGQIVRDFPSATYTDILRVHRAFLYETVERLSLEGSGEIGNTVLATPLTLEMALKAAGACISGLLSVLNGTTGRSLCVVRPPGHHATRDASDGLCVFNNIAIAIEAARQARLGSKFAIIDIDTHYGDGIASIYYEDPTILYCSLHEMDFTQGERGTPHERGVGKGKNFNINFPVPMGTGDNDYLVGLDLVLQLIEKFQPEVLIVAAGFDAHFADPIGNLRLTTKGYREIGQRLTKLADMVCKGRVCYCLEGGYNLLAVPPSLVSLVWPDLYDSIGVPDKNMLVPSHPDVKILLESVQETFLDIFENYWRIEKKK